MSDLSEQEEQQLMMLLAGEATLAQGLELYNSLTKKNIPFPMEWELKVLELSHAADPDRKDILYRYRHVLLALGYQVPQDVELRAKELAKKEEYTTNHQASAATYHAMSGLDDTEESFRNFAKRVQPYTMTSFERMYALFKAIEYIELAGIPGDIVECGVWRGGSMMLAALTLLELGSTTRDLYLFDTFEGLPKPDEGEDVDLWGNRAIDGWLPKRTSDQSSHWAEAGLEEVKENLLQTGYPSHRIRFIKGMVEETIPSQAPKEIALLRLDTDWYSSTRHEMRYLYPRLTRNGVLIIDDYGHFKGAKRAVDEYFRDNEIPILLQRIDYTGRLAVKAI
jgi:hypothetical protein